MPLFGEGTIEGLSVTDKGTSAVLNFQGNSEGEHVAIQATSPWIYGSGSNTVYYYEVSLNAVQDAVGIGIATANFPTTGAMPGWLPTSYGYHCDDGNRFAGGSARKGWPVWTAGDVAGLGLRSATGELFGTLNGKLLGIVDTLTDDSTEYFPTIGFNAPAVVQVHFDNKDFKFDPATLPENLVPLFGPLETTDRSTSKLVVLFVNDVDAEEQEKLKKEVEKVAPIAKSKFGFQSLFTSEITGIAAGVREFVGLLRFPMLAIVDIQKGDKFVLPEGQPITAENITQYLELIAAGNVESLKKSAPRPPNDRNAAHPSLLQVVGTSFNELVIQTKKDVLLDVYADWCGPCNAIAPTIATLADVLADNENIAIAKIDCDANDVNRKYLPETSIPNIKLFPASNKEEPIKYEGDRSLNSFLEFIHSHASVKFDLDAAKVKGKILQEEKEKKALKNVKHVESTEEFNDYLKQQDKLVMVDYFATWCPPCKAIAPFYADLSEEFKDVLFLKVNVDSLVEVSKEQDITCMPTFKIYKNGNNLGKVEGASPGKLKELITSNLSS